MEIGIVGIIIIIITGIVSFKGFKDAAFFKSNMFQIDPILLGKQYKRIVTSAFLHANGNHLFFNILTFIFFAPTVNNFAGELGLLIVYFLAMVGGSLLSLYIHRNNGSYSAIGASGAVSGILFAAIAFEPGMKLFFFLIPIPIPAYIFGLGYMIYTINGIRKQNDRIGHEAHLGGAIVGVLIAIFIKPEILQTNLLTISLILIPVAVFIAILAFKPSLFFVQGDYEVKKEYLTQDDKYNIQKQRRQKTVDYLLDKINEKGISSLTDEERRFLDKNS